MSIPNKECTHNKLGYNNLEELIKNKSGLYYFKLQLVYEIHTIKSIISSGINKKNQLLVQS